MHRPLKITKASTGPMRQSKKTHPKRKVSILDDLDFELELIHRDAINVTYILKLLAKLKDAKPEEKESQEKSLVELVAGNAKLRSKRELIEKFIRENMPAISDPDEIPKEFDNFWSEERKQALIRLSEEENQEGVRRRSLI